MFGKILIANRGEIACRIIRSARALGIRTVAVYSDADRNALHARRADEAVHIGAAAPGESYLDLDRLLAACRITGAQAVHPGYGFLAENAGFAAACEAAGIVFIGPSPQAIRLMGNKAEAKRRMRAAGVPCLTGYDGADQSDASFMAEAQKIGLPLMIKAAAGGGGRGMRRVADFDALPAALASARSEALAAFGSTELILEQALAAPRHVEIQVFGDSHGSVIHLGERDCSIQRRHQKVIEEAPAPGVSTELRERMGAAAIAAARAIDYIGAGTVEFLLDAAGRFHFMEMNTRLQVEHAVTEMITGVDLVALQIRVAAGQALPFAQDDVHLAGHAIEARLYAEDPDAGFLPRSGPLLLWQAPRGEGVRVDCGVESGSEVTTFYDPLLAKIVACGATREEARLRLMGALRECVALGPATNKAFLLGCLEHAEFFRGCATTDFVAAHFVPASDTDPRMEALAAAALLFIARGVRRLPQPWLAHWRSNGAAVSHLLLAVGATRVPLTVTAFAADRFTITAGGAAVEATIVEQGADTLLIQVGALRHRVRYAFDADARLHLDVAGGRHVIADAAREPAALRGADSASGVVTPPMNGRIVAVLVQNGTAVRRGQGLLVLESMKMEHTLGAPCDGVVAQLACLVGEQVAPGRTLLVVAPVE